MKQSSLHIYNSLTAKKELFHPISNQVVGMYVCGPTVYGPPHLGHARSAITFDIIFRYLKHLGYKVRYVRNITDVGHLEDETNDSGEDKILKKARIAQLEPMEVAQHYTNIYRGFMDQLNIQKPSIEPVASGHILEQIAIIQKILEAKMAYEINGSVYFDMKAYVQKYSYGILSGRSLENVLEGSRTNLIRGTEKRYHADFALWKKATQEHIMQWHSPWGTGFPGWHIECTAMSTKYLGTQFDIHGGGMDLKFPHHEAEIAQNCAAFNTIPAKYWIHNNMVTLDGQKMAKSKGNFISLEAMFSGEHSLLEKAYSPMTVRFFMLQAHYRSLLDFSNSGLQAAEKALKKLQSGYKKLTQLKVKETVPQHHELTNQLTYWCKQCEEAMNNDFNTAKVIAALFEINSLINQIASHPTLLTSIDSITLAKVKETYSVYFHNILGITDEEPIQFNAVEDVVDILLEIREEARANKNFELSDMIRNRLQVLNIELNDTKNGKTTRNIS